jgi:hypothetical protein
MRPLHLLSAVLPLVVLTGCAAPGLRELAGAEASSLNTYRTSLQEFANQQSQLNADNDQRLRRLAELRARNDAYVAERLTALAVNADKSASEIYGLVTAHSASDITTNSVALHAAQPTASSPVAAYDATQVTAVVKELTTLSTPPSRWTQLAGDIAYAKSVKDAYQTSLTAATKAAGAAQTQAKATTDAAAASNAKASK